MIIFLQQISQAQSSLFKNDSLITEEKKIISDLFLDLEPSLVGLLTLEELL